MNNLFIKLDNDKIVNLNLVTVIVRSERYSGKPYAIYFCDSGTEEESITISQEEYEKIHSLLFGCTSFNE